MDNLKKITIVVPNGEVVLSSIAGCYKLFKAASEFRQSKLKIEIVGSQKKHTFLDDLFTINPQKDFKQVNRTDLIIVPALKSGLPEILEENNELTSWLNRQYDRGAHIASLCTGSFLLANAGLLKNKRCTTHWAFSKQFVELYPETQFQQNGIITEEDRLFTSGGAYSFLSLIVYLIERFFDKETARFTINMFQIDYARSTQSQFAVFDTQKNHSDKSILKVQNHIEEYYCDKLSNEELAAIAKLSPRTFVRRFKKHCGNSPNEYLQRVRIEAAKDLLVSTNKLIGEIQLDVGYGDSKTFRSIFLRLTGLMPADYRNRYRSVW